VLPGGAVRYHEDVVDNLEGSVRRILEFCDCPSSRRVLSSTHRAQRRTASSEAGASLFIAKARSVERTTTMAGSLKDALGDALERYRH